MKYAMLVLKYLGTVLQAMKDVEVVIGAGNGKAKKEVILGAISAAAKVGATVDVPEIAVWSAVVDSTVTVLNESGVFQHGTQAGSPTGTVTP